jgi:hypothetical protein
MTLEIEQEHVKNKTSITQEVPNTFLIEMEENKNGQVYTCGGIRNEFLYV